MAHAKKINWVMDCLANQWKLFSPEELTAYILQDEPEDTEIRRRTLGMVSAWQNNQSNVRGKYQIMKEAESNQLLESFIRNHLRLI